MKHIYLVLLSILILPLSTNAKMLCGPLLKIKSKRIYTQDELQIIESLSSTFLSTQIKRSKGALFHGIKRVQVNDPSTISPEDILSSITTENKEALIKIVQDNLSDFGRNINWSMHEHLKQRNKGKAKKSTEHTNHIMNMINKADRMEEAKIFVRQNIDAIIVNASITPIHSRFITFLKGTKKFAIVFSGVTATFTAIGTAGLAWLIVPVETAALSIGIGTTFGAFASLTQELFSPVTHPKFFWHEHRFDLGEDVRAQFNSNTDET